MLNTTLQGQSIRCIWGDRERRSYAHSSFESDLYNLMVNIQVAYYDLCDLGRSSLKVHRESAAELGSCSAPRPFFLRDRPCRSGQGRTPLCARGLKRAFATTPGLRKDTSKPRGTRVVRRRTRNIISAKPPKIYRHFQIF